MGLILDTSILISAERARRKVAEVLVAVERIHGQTALGSVVGWASCEPTSQNEMWGTRRPAYLEHQTFDIRGLRCGILMVSGVN